MACSKLFPVGSGDITIICKLSNDEPRVLGIFMKDFLGSGLYSHIRRTLQAQKTSNRALNPVVEVAVDAGELIVLLEALLSGEASSSSRLALWRSIVLARLSPIYGTPEVTAKAMNHLYDVFCCSPHDVYQLSFTPADFPIAAAAVEMVIALKETHQWLFNGVLAYFAQFSPALMSRPAFFEDDNPPTHRLYNVPPKYRDICLEVHEKFLYACEYRLDELFKGAAYECKTRPQCSAIMQGVRDDAQDDHTLIGALTRPSPELAKRLQGLCAECHKAVAWSDQVALYVLWSGTPAVFDDDRKWDEIRASAQQYLKTLPPVELESGSDDDSDSSSESESESRGREARSRKKAKVVTSEDDRGFIDILSKALNWLE
ncbi:hypothetical protein EV714DRAFT_213828 [Schizophyllum commune]